MMIWIIFHLFLFVLFCLGTFFALFHYYNPNTCIPPSSPYLIHHRGYHKDHPGGTIEAILAAFDTDYHGVEFDIQINVDNTFWAFHDLTTYRFDGKDTEFRLLTNEQIMELRDLEFGKYRISSFNEIMSAICERKKPFKIYLDVKDFGRHDYEFADILFNEIESHECGCDVVIAIGLASWYRTNMIQRRNESKCNPYLNLYFTYGDEFDQYFWIKSRLIYFYTDMEIIEMGYWFVEKHPEILQAMDRDGICTAHYGATPDIMNNPKANYAATISQELDDYVYTPNPWPYNFVWITYISICLYYLFLLTRTYFSQLFKQHIKKIGFVQLSQDPKNL